MSSEIYKEMKKGWKVNIGRDIGQRCRNFIYNAGWDQIDNEAIETITDQVFHLNYFSQLAIQDVEDQKQISDFENLIHEKVAEYFGTFAERDATARQVFYYIELCHDTGEKYQEIINNKEIHIEISRLIKLKDKQEFEMIEDIKQNQLAYMEMHEQGIV